MTGKPKMMEASVCAGLSIKLKANDIIGPPDPPSQNGLSDILSKQHIIHIGPILCSPVRVYIKKIFRVHTLCNRTVQTLIT